MNTELKAPATQSEAIRLLDVINNKVSRQNADTRMAYAQLKELIRLLLPE